MYALIKLVKAIFIRKACLLFRHFARRYPNKQRQIQGQRHQLSVPYPNSSEITGTQSGTRSYRLVVQRRGSTPSPNRVHPDVSSRSLLPGDIYEDFRTNSLGRGKPIESRISYEEHVNDPALHRSTSPVYKR